jgi:chromosomal replication initiation ATPase DnaA
MTAPRTLHRADLVARAQLAVLRARIRALEGVQEHPSTRSRFGKIIDLVAAEFEVLREAIISERRDAEPALARHVVMALAQRQLAYSLPRIGRLIGRDHTTVLHGIRRIDALCKADPAFAARLDVLAARIEQQSRSDA